MGKGRAGQWSLLRFVLPFSLVLGFIIVFLGGSLYPRLFYLAAPLVCPGEVTHVFEGKSYQPGEYIVSMTAWCAGASETGARTDITNWLLLYSFLIYSAIAALVLQFLLVPWARYKLRKRLDRLGIAPADTVAGMVEQMKEGARSGRIPLKPGSMAERMIRAEERERAQEGGGGGGGGIGDAAARLANLKRLRDEGLLTSEEYEAKRAEIIGGL